MIVNIDLIWETARRQIAEMLDYIGNDLDLATTRNFREIITFTSNGATPVNVPHGMFGKPKGYVVTRQNGVGSVYWSSDPDSTNMYFESDVVGIEFDIMIF